MADPAPAWYSYAVVRLVPRVERQEFLNIGVVLFARQAGFLEACIELDERRAAGWCPGIDLARLREHVAVFSAIAVGDRGAGPLAEYPASERFHWLTAPRSTIIQTSPVHIGRCDDPAATLDALMDEFVRPIASH